MFAKNKYSGGLNALGIFCGLPTCVSQGNRDRRCNRYIILINNSFIPNTASIWDKDMIIVDKGYLLVGVVVTYITLVPN